MENRTAVSQKLKHRMTTGIQQFHFWGCTQKSWKQGLKADVCTLLFPAWQHYTEMLSIAALFTIAKGPLTDERINKTWCIHKMEYYSALKRKEILAHSPTQMNLEDIMRSEISPSRKDRYCKTPPTWLPSRVSDSWLKETGGCLGLGRGRGAGSV